MIHAKVNGWSNRLPSQGGKEVFLKAVIQAIPTYTMSCFLLQKMFCQEINRLISNFW